MSDVTPWTVAHQAPLSMGFPRKEYWSELPFPSPADLPDPGIEPALPAWQVDSLPLRHQESPTSPGQPLIYFLTLWICLSGHFIQMESCMCSPLWLTYFIEHGGFKAHAYMYYYIPCISTSSFLQANNIPFHGYATLFIHLSVNRYLSCFHFLAIMNNAAVDIHIQFFVWIYVFIFLGYIPRCGEIQFFAMIFFFLFGKGKGHLPWWCTQSWREHWLGGRKCGSEFYVCPWQAIS